MDLLLFLILFPVLAAILLLITPGQRAKGYITYLAALVTGVVSVVLLALYAQAGKVLMPFPAEPAGQIMLVLGTLVALYLVYLSVKQHQWIPVLLLVVLTGMMLYTETMHTEALAIAENLFIDQFTLVMTVIIGVIGGLICVYAVPYMAQYHVRHTDIRDRRGFFFFLLFIFLSAMFGLVFANNLRWVFFFWEITTLCSFLLIGYTETGEAQKNAFLALNMNLLGGIAFAGAILWIALAAPHGMIGMDALLSAGQAVAVVPAALIGFAGLTKSAQMPFSQWLVGAMVAPTPVSALLHSSTMVKAGVYVIIRFAPILSGSVAGYMLGLVGGSTFVIASCIAISQRNAKKVLAYSTIANLGLIVACAGIGTYQAIWAAVMLIIFHAVAKALLFLGVGCVEHGIGSRDIEDMNGLVIRMPYVSAMLAIGIAGMFLAPFGMLISKWAAIEAFLQAPFGLLFVSLLAYGSAVTVFFWTKWLGRIIAITPPEDVVEGILTRTEWLVLVLLSAFTAAATFAFPLVSSRFVEPYILAVYGTTTLLAQDNIIIMLLMLAILLILPAALVLRQTDGKVLPQYMAGRTTTPKMEFYGTFGVNRQMSLGNYYLSGLFGEAALMRSGIIVSTVLLVIMAATFLAMKVI